jgi:hypothetical protein
LNILGFHLLIFIDDQYQTSEAQQKWISRREKEV